MSCNGGAIPLPPHWRDEMAKITEVTFDNLNLSAADVLVALRNAIHQIELYGACELELGGEVLIEITANEFDDGGVGEIGLKY